MAQDTAALTQAHAEARYQALLTQVDQNAGDPDYDYALGIAANDSGRFGEAIIAFQRVLAVRPNDAAARSELARAYAMAGDIDTARAQFATVVDDPSLPDPVRQRFTGFIRQFDRQIAGGGSDVSGYVDARIGHDSNINSATDLTTITIPLFSFLGPGTLGAGARSQSDEFYEFTAGVSGVTAISRQDRVFASVLGNYRDNFDSKAFDQAVLTGTVGFAHSFGNRDVLSLSGQVQQFWLGADPFRLSYGATAQYTRSLTQGRALTLPAGGQSKTRSAGSHATWSRVTTGTARARLPGSMPWASSWLTTSTRRRCCGVRPMRANVSIPDTTAQRRRRLRALRPGTYR